MDDSGPPASRFAPNGDRFTALLFLDFNSMYLWSQEQFLPLSPGIHWTMSDGFFKKKPLGGNTSLSALQWIYYQQAELKKSGVKIQHAYFQGEEKIEGYLVDGYAVIRGEKTVFEYNGCSVSINLMKILWSMSF